MSLLPFTFTVLCLLCACGARGNLGNLRNRLVAAGLQSSTALRRSYSVETFSAKACRSGASISRASGVIASPGFSRNKIYKDDLKCRWTIRAPRNKIVRIVVEFADIRCPDALELFNYQAGHATYHLASVCGPKTTNAVSNDETAIYTDSPGAVITLKSFAGEKKGRGFKLSYTIVDPEERPCGCPRIEPFVPGMSGGEAGNSMPLPPGTLPLAPGMPPGGLPVLPLSPRIIGGFEAVPFSWPWHASVGFYDVNFCGSAIINKRWVVTAAHCVGDPWEASDLEVTVGIYNTSNPKEPSQQTLALTEMIVHPNYNPDNYDNDIALLHLADDIRWAPEVSPVCLPTRDVAANTICVTTGWGKNEITWPDTLHQVKLPIVDMTVCRQPTWHGANITENMICAGYPEGGKDTCQGDSGSPLVCKEGNNWVLYGLTSWGKGVGCGDPNSPGVYTRVTRFMSWMNQYIHG